MIRPFYLSGVPTLGKGSFEVRSPFDGRLVAEVSSPTAAQAEQAVADLDAVRYEARALPAHVRAAALDHISARLAERSEEIAALITAENGKPTMWATSEVARAVSTFRWAAVGRDTSATRLPSNGERTSKLPSPRVGTPER